MFHRKAGLLAFFTLAIFWNIEIKAASAEESPSEIFFEPPDLRTPQLSPGGGKICALTRFDNIHFELTLIELPTMKVSALARPAKMTVRDFLWKNDNLLFFIAKTDDGVAQFRSIELASRKIHALPDLGVYPELELINVLSDDPEQMLFRAQRINSDENDLVKINVKTGAEQVVERDPGGVTQWFTNRAGEAVAGLGSNSEKTFLFWREKPKDHWQKRVLSEKNLPLLVPFGVASDGRRLIVKDYRTSNMARVCYYDPVNDTTNEEIEQAHEVEPTELLTWGYDQEPGAISYPTDRIPRHFLNPDMQRGFELLDKFLPGTLQGFISFSKGNTKAITAASNDRNAGGFCLLDLTTGKFTVLGLYLRSLNPAKMSPSRDFDFTASDGLKISGRITLPLGKKKPPLIVQLGPALTNPARPLEFYSRDQFFASRGYATVRINYRGTSGFGRDFATAGDLQITGMGRDIVEGVEWLKTQGWIDGDRVALLGEKWGGLIAFSLAVQKSSFKGLLNFDTIINPPTARIDFFAPSGKPKKAVLESIGGSSAGEAYVAKYSLLNAVPALSIPSFHHYTSNIVGSPTDDADRLKNALKKYKKDYEFTGSLCDQLLIKQNITPWKEEARQFEAAVAFLNKHLGIPGQSE